MKKQAQRSKQKQLRPIRHPALRSRGTAERKPRRVRRRSITASAGEPPDAAHIGGPHTVAPPPTACFTPAEEQQFTALFCEHCSWALAVARSRWGWRIDVEAAVNEALRKAMLGFRPDRGGSFRSYLYFVLSAELINVWRKQAKHIARLVPLADDFDVVDEAAESGPVLLRDRLERLQRIIPQLSSQERILFYLRYEAELSLNEILRCF